jgi:hypothetical protein
MHSDEEDTDIKVYWGDVNDYTIENWIELGKKLFSFVTPDKAPPNGDYSDKMWMRADPDGSEFYNFGDLKLRF